MRWAASCERIGATANEAPFEMLPVQKLVAHSVACSVWLAQRGLLSGARTAADSIRLEPQHKTLWQQVISKFVVCVSLALATRVWRWPLKASCKAREMTVTKK